MGKWGERVSTGARCMYFGANRRNSSLELLRLRRTSGQNASAFLFGYHPTKHIYIYIHSKPHHQTPWLLWFSHVKIYEMWDEHSWPNSSMERWLQGFVPSLVMPIWGWKLSEHVNRPTAPNMNIWLWLNFLEQTWRIPISERTRIHN